MCHPDESWLAYIEELDVPQADELAGSSWAHHKRLAVQGSTAGAPQHGAIYRAVKQLIEYEGLLRYRDACDGLKSATLRDETQH